MAAIPAEHAAIFAGIRQEMVESMPARPRAVPRSFRAAILAGLVTGFFLAGLDIGQPAPTEVALQPLLQAAGLDTLQYPAKPYLIALSLLAGARTAATALLIAHRLLAMAGQVSLPAYALGGAALEALIAGGLQLAGAGAPHHGWMIEIAAGAVAGFFYRLFAGAKPAAQQDLSPDA